MALTIQQLQNFVDSNPDLRQLVNVIVDYLQANPAGGLVIPETAYASNSDAVEALGVGKLYKSTTDIFGSPIILITV